MSYFTKDGFSEGVPNELLLFDLPPTQVAVNDVHYQEIRPISQVSDDTPIEFQISGQNSMDYLDLKDTQLCVKLKVTNPDGSNLKSGEKVGPVNLFLQALFSIIEVTLQNKAVISSNYNPYIAMFNTLLCNGKDASFSQLSSQLFIKDDNDHPEDCDPSGANNGLFLRAKYITESKTLELQGPIYHSLFTIKRYLLNQVDVNVKLYRSSPAFCLSSGETSPSYKVNITDSYLLVKKVRVNPALIVAHSEMLKINTAKYPFDRLECRLQTIAAGSTVFTWDNLFQGQKPNTIVVAFVRSAAISGDYKSNPFHFLNCDIRSICLYADGVPVWGNPLKTNFNNLNGESFMRVYANMFLTNGMWNKDAGLDINREDFARTSCIFTFQLEPKFSDEAFLSLIKTGNVRLEVQFGTALSTATSCIVYNSSPGFFQINAQRDIITE